MFARFFITLALFAGFVASVPAQDFNVQGKVIFDRNPVTGQITGATCSVGWNTISCPPNLLREVQQQVIFNRAVSQGGCRGITFDGVVPVSIHGLPSAFRLGGCLNAPREEPQTRVVVVQQVTQVAVVPDGEKKRLCLKIEGGREVSRGMLTDDQCSAIVVPRGSRWWDEQVSPPPTKNADGYDCFLNNRNGVLVYDFLSTGANNPLGKPIVTGAECLAARKLYGGN